MVLDTLDQLSINVTLIEGVQEHYNSNLVSEDILSYEELTDFFNCSDLDTMKRNILDLTLTNS